MIEAAMLPDLAKHSEKLIYFFEIAEEGSIQAAGRKLGISAPSLSHAVKSLEEVIGTPLFLRSKSGVTLTDAGKKLLIFCRKYFREMEEVQRIMLHPNQQMTTRIRIGTFQTIALYFWPLLIDKLKQDSSISLSIMTNRSKVILESLMKREIDIALTVEALEHERLIRHELYKDDYAFYCSAKWSETKIGKSDLLNHALLYIPDAIDQAGKSLRQHLQSWDLVFRDEFELDSLEVIGEFVKKEYGIGILPTKVAKSHNSALKQLKIEGVGANKFGAHRFFLSCRDDLELPQKLMKTLLEAAKEAVLQMNS